MLSEKEIEALKNGAYGVTRDGRKVKYLGENVVGGHFWLEGLEDNKVKVISYDRFDHYYIGRNQSPYDIVGLWEDKLEPFTPEKALAGEPVLLRDGEKAFVISDIKSLVPISDYSLVGITPNGTLLRWNCEGSYWLTTDEDELDIIGMWKEPEPVKPNADGLPKPIRDLMGLEEVWHVALDVILDKLTPSVVVKPSIGWASWHHTRASNGVYYASKENCQKACDLLTGVDNG
ncbi:hypothetical protein BKK51_07280 [Rodentibacter trehalosifermentans]|uniref:Uncharacterized protein n=1 Tax=Rodentibacter trehalosifermentans TaxID=1908263 RepID=A0A1V3J241_9PAST|nr:hypothetical protein [Rodentibacter trehalosifermentans]OOF45156.1 hypothetical protein BKK51_07280 [Rodentibacter trehalosifermentans]OOF48915.1 hypothetical protein BKK52_04940 [Rodentibacter trehalosifermentans]